MLTPCYDLMLDSMTIANMCDFAGMLVFDQWTCNADPRQVVLVGEPGSGVLTAIMIDQGYCFGKPFWDFRNYVFNGIFSHKRVYAGVRGIDSFEPWLERLEKEVSFNSIIEASRCIPAEWYDDDQIALQALLVKINNARSKVRDLLFMALTDKKDVFPSANLGKGARREVVSASRTTMTQGTQADKLLRSAL